MRRFRQPVVRFELRTWTARRATWWLFLRCGHVAVRHTSVLRTAVVLPPERCECVHGCAVQRVQVKPLPDKQPDEEAQQ